MEIKQNSILGFLDKVVLRSWMDSYFVLVYLGFCNKISHTGWLVNNIYLFVTVLETAKSKIMVLADLVFGSMEEGGKGALWKLFNKGTNPVHEGSTLKT